MEVNYGGMGYGSITKEEAQRREELFKNGIKVCSKCKMELTLDMFTKDSTTKYGLSTLCKDCQREQRKRRKEKIDQWFENNQERVKEQQKKYSKEHAEEKMAYNHERKEYFAQKRKEYEQQNIDKVREQRKKYRKSLNARYKKYELGAKKRKLAFELSKEEFDEITKRPCFYCEEFSDECNGVPYNGVDRIDSSEGYIRNNCVPCCEMCNRMKLDYDLYEWLKHIKKIADTLFEKEN